ncbi:hypothetical protein PN836_009790 [Ningiella sp. W23]|uniref:hypothetical protein n=1 Tax=Ningiella sp. W23 TaxID=3023715 RepID=UPI003757072F
MNDKFSTVMHPTASTLSENTYSKKQKKEIQVADKINVELNTYEKSYAVHQRQSETKHIGQIIDLEEYVDFVNADSKLKFVEDIGEDLSHISLYDKHTLEDTPDLPVVIGDDLSLLSSEKVLQLTDDRDRTSSINIGEDLSDSDIYSFQ